MLIDVDLASADNVLDEDYMEAEKEKLDEIPMKGAFINQFSLIRVNVVTLV